MACFGLFHIGNFPHLSGDLDFGSHLTEILDGVLTVNFTLGSVWRFLPLTRGVCKCPAAEQGKGQWAAYSVYRLWLKCFLSTGAGAPCLQSLRILKGIKAWCHSIVWNELTTRTEVCSSGLPGTRGPALASQVLYPSHLDSFLYLVWN